MSDRSEEFSQAVNSPGRNSLVIAPPGCGKTELLAYRALANVESLTAGRRILALTFSNKAKANLKSRLVKVVGAERNRRSVTVHNFHGHAAEIVRSHGSSLDIPTDFEVPDKHTQRTVIEPYLEGLGEYEALDVARLIEDELRTAKAGPYTDRQVLERLRRDGDARSARVEEDRQRKGLMFFDDLLRHAQRLLRIREISWLYRNHFSAVIVDEFQDLSTQQLDIVLRTSDVSRTFAGDPLQGIYSWAGANPVEVERILRRISGKPLSLGTSYRSSPKVLETLGSVSMTLGGQRLDARNPAEWFEGGITAGCAFETGEDEATFIRRTAALILSQNSSATIGVLCRSGWRRKLIDAEFAGSTVPSTRWDLAVDNPAVIDHIQLAAARLGGRPTLAEIRDNLIQSIAVNDVDMLSDIKEALDQLESLVETAGSVGSALAQLRLQEDEADVVPPGVHLLNGHLGKGQQFDWVFIPGFEDGNIPSFQAKTSLALEEEKRVLLVMISRARHGLVFSRSKTLVSKKRKIWKPEPSRWTTDVRSTLRANGSDLVAHIRRMPASPSE